MAVLADAEVETRGGARSSIKSDNNSSRRSSEEVVMLEGVGVETRIPSKGGMPASLDAVTVMIRNSNTISHGNSIIITSEAVAGGAEADALVSCRICTRNAPFHDCRTT